MDAALIENGMVTNVIVVDALDAMPELELVPADDLTGARAEIGDGWDGEQFIKSASSAPVVPAQVTMRQARLALLGAGMLQTVKDAVAAMPEAAQIEWETAGTVERNSPIVAALSPLLGLDDAQLDALFIHAINL